MVFYRVLELAAAHDPVRYRELILNPRRNTLLASRPPPAGGPRALTVHPPNGPGEAPSAQLRLDG